MKKNKILILFALIAAVCVIHLYSYREGLGIYWRQWSSVQRHFNFNEKFKLELRNPFLSRSIASQDPEAAAIVELIYHESKDNFNDIDYLSEQSLKYPDNPYFLYDLACRIASRTYIDPEIIDAIADRLIQLNPKNGRYYFLKAWAVFYDWGDNRIEKTLEYLDMCFSLDHTEPYLIYKDRVCSLAEKEKPSVYLANEAAEWGSYGELYLLRNLIKDVLACTQDMIVNSDSERAMKIHDKLEQIAEKSIPQTVDTPRQFWLLFHAAEMLYPETPQTIELKWMSLNPQRAAQDRLQMLAWNSFMDEISAQRQQAKSAAKSNHSHWIESGIPLAAHCFEMTIASLIILLGYFVFGLFLKMQYSRIGFAVFTATVFSLIFMIICRWNDYRCIFGEKMCPCQYYNFGYVPLSETMTGFLLWGKSHAGYIGIISGFLLCITVAYFLKNRILPKLLFRILIRTLGFLFVLSLWLLVSRFHYAAPIFDMLLLATILPLLCFPVKNIKTGGYSNVFSSTDDGMQFRGRCVTIGAYLVALHLVCFALFASSLVNYTSDTVAEKKQEFFWPSITSPRLNINDAEYRQFLDEFKTKPLEQIKLQKMLFLVNPPDIPAVLTIVKERRANDPNGFISAEMGPLPIELTCFYGAKDDYLFDLPGVMESCGRDALPYILPFLKEPNRIETLIIRGRAGDVSVSQRLVELWKKNRDAGFSAEQAMRGDVSPDAGAANVSVPLEAMVGIVPYSEIRDYILEYSRWTVHHNERFIPDRNLMMYFTRQQKGNIISSILPLLKEKSKLTGNGFELLGYDSELDAASKEWLWRQLIDDGNKENEKSVVDVVDLESRPSDCHISDELLTECLNNKNECLRAMGQHIWRKLGKPLNRELLHCWANDSNFTIRANAAILVSDSVQSDDPSPFVRLVWNLTTRNQVASDKKQNESQPGGF